MWVFGGRDEDNNKLNDLWRFDIAANVWQEVRPVDGIYPLERSGHCCDVYEGQYMVVFGGIYEITKELNDLHMFDFAKRKWVTVFEESNSPIKGGREISPAFVHNDSDIFQQTAGTSGTNGSPGTKKSSIPILGKHKSTINHFASPTKGKSRQSLAPVSSNKKNLNTSL